MVTQEKDDLGASYKTSQDNLTIRVRELETAIAAQRLHESTIKMLQDQLYDSQQKVEITAEELATVICVFLVDQ